MIANRELRKEIFALYAGVPVEEFNSGALRRAGNGIRWPAKVALNEYERKLLWPVTVPLKKKLGRLDITYEQATEIEKNALLKLKDYRITEQQELTKWDGLETCIKNDSANYDMSWLGASAQEYLNAQLVEIESKYGADAVLDTRQAMIETLVVSEHYKRTPIQRMGLWGQMYDQLKSLGVKTATDITQYSEKDLVRPGFVGKEGVENLKNKLTELGLQLSQ